MWRLVCFGQTQQPMQALAFLQQLPQLSALRSCSAATAAVQQLRHSQNLCSLQPTQQQYHKSNHSCTNSHRLSYSTTADPSSSDSTSQPQQDQPVIQDAVRMEALASSDSANMEPAAAAGRYRQFAHIEPSGFVTLPSRATASGYPESFAAASSSSSSRVKQVPLEQVQLPQERLRIQLRQEVQQEEDTGGAVDAYSLSRSLIPGAQSFDSAAAAAATAADTAPQQQQQHLSAEDRQLLEKLVGIMTKEGKKSRARRLLLDAMHIIKQQVAKGQHV